MCVCVCAKSLQSCRTLCDPIWLSAIQKNETMPFAATQMDLEIVIHVTANGIISLFWMADNGMGSQRVGHDLSAIQENWVRSLSREDPLEQEMATHSSTLAWKIPWTEEPGGPQSMGSQRVSHSWATNTHTHRLSYRVKSKSDREGEISYDIPYMWNLKRNDTNKLTKQTHRLKVTYFSNNIVSEC